MSESAPGSGFIIPRSHENITAKGSKFLDFNLLADEFTSICTIDLGKLTPEQVRQQLIEKGFPAGLASYLGSSLLERISDARQTLAMAAAKPQMRAMLLEDVKTGLVEYFKLREAEIVRFFEVSEDPKSYLKIISHALTAIDTGKFSDQEVIDAFEALRKLSKEGAEKLTRPITQVAFEFCKKRGLDANLVSDTHILISGNTDHDLSNELFKHLRERFPGAHAHGGTATYKEKYGYYIVVSYSL